MARMSRLRPVRSNKNIVRFSNLLEAGAVTRDVIVVQAVDSYAGGVSQCPIGATVNGFFFEINFNVEGNITTVVDWAFWKNPGNLLGALVPSLTGGSPFRKWVFKQGMEMPAGINNAGAVKRIGVAVVPKKMKRMGDQDIINFTYLYAAAGNIADTCGHFIYKWYA